MEKRFEQPSLSKIIMGLCWRLNEDEKCVSQVKRCHTRRILAIECVIEIQLRVITICNNQVHYYELSTQFIASQNEITPTIKHSILWLFSQ